MNTGHTQRVILSKGQGSTEGESTRLPVEGIRINDEAELDSYHLTPLPKSSCYPA